MFKIYTKHERIKFRDVFDENPKNVYDTLAIDFPYETILKILFIGTMNNCELLENDGYDAFIDKSHNGIFFSGFSNVDKSVIIHFNPILNKIDSLKSHIDIKIAYIDPSFVSYSTSYELPLVLSEEIKIDVEICQRVFHHNIDFIKGQITLLSMGDTPEQ